MILVTGATSNVGRHVVSQLLGTDVAGHGFACNPHSVGLPDDVDVMRADLSVPDTLDECLDGVEAVFLIKHTRRIVYLSSEGVGDDLEQQTDTFTARSAAKLAA